MSLETAEAQ